MKWVALVLAVAVAGVVASVIVFVAARANGLPAGPIEPVWDRTACAWCQMHVGEPAFAAQLHTSRGDVHFYDDPGCLFEHLATGLEPRALWFRHLREPRWLPGDGVAFVEVAPTPMGYGLGAVESGAGEITLEQAEQRVAARERGGR